MTLILRRLLIVFPISSFEFAKSKENIAKSFFGGRYFFIHTVYSDNFIVFLFVDYAYRYYMCCLKCINSCVTKLLRRV